MSNPNNIFVRKSTFLEKIELFFNLVKYVVSFQKIIDRTWSTYYFQSLLAPMGK